MIQAISDDPPVLTRPITFELGRSLAEVILLFHGTPWVPLHWNSRAVHFFSDIRGFIHQAESRRPFLALDFTKSDMGKGKQKEQAEPLGCSAPPDPHSDHRMREYLSVRNEVLFGLGIMLLEIGYSEAWENLRQKVPDHMSDYSAAEKLSRSLLRSGISKGPGYYRIIRKCLGCDFGLGETDLGDEELQELFARQVIDALGSMEKSLETWNLETSGGRS